MYILQEAGVVIAAVVLGNVLLSGGFLLVLMALDAFGKWGKRGHV